MNRTQLLVATFATILSVITTPSAAETPDGTTPATEDVCDVLKGGTPGLYGLCVAYCEAQDNELLVDPSDPNNQPTVASTKILDKYRERMLADDPDMPCLQPAPACRCWAQSDIDSVGLNNGTALYCVPNEYIWENGIPTSTGSTLIYAQVYPSRSSCIWYNPDSFGGLSGTSPVIQLTPEEYAVCESQINTRITEAQADCTI